MKNFKSLVAGLLLGAFFIASANAQGQLASGQIWANDTASPGLPKPSTIDSVLARIGGLSATRLMFTQNGTGAQSVSVDALLRGKMFIPEMYASGAISAPVGTAAASVPDATSAIQAAVNALCAIPGGGNVRLGPGAYAITVVNINCSNVWIIGSGPNATTLVHKLTGPSSALFFSAGASILSNTGVMGLTIASNDTVFTKIAINASDVSYFTVRNVSVAHYPVDGTLYRASGGTGTALFTQGREHGVVESFQAYAEQPLRITVNPNSTISMDSWVFRNLVLVSQLSTATYHDITIDANVNIYNTVFDGHQNWIGGVDGLHWVDTTSTQASLGLYISGVKSEQSGVSGASGYTVNIQHNTALDLLKIDGVVGGDRALTKLRKVNAATLRNVYFDPTSGTGTNTVGFDIDATVLSMTVEKALWTNVGGRATTSSVAGQNILSQGPTPTGFSATVPSDVVYTTSTPTVTLGNVALIGSTANRLLLGQGGGAAVTSMGAGTTAQVLHGNAGGASTFGSVVSSDLNITPTTCSNQLISAISASGVGTCTTVSSQLSLGTSNTMAQASTWFVGIGGNNAAEGFVLVPMAQAGTIDKMYCQTQAAPAAGQTFTQTIRKAAADTALTCQMTSAGTTCNDTTHSFSVVAGDIIDIKVVTSATSGTANGMNCGMRLTTPVP